MSAVTAVLVAAVTAVAMEPAAALLHRAVMHGSGWAWHRSHHRPRRGTFERNDLFPVTFAGLTIAAMAVATVSGHPGVVAAGWGVTAYGLAYLAVHDLCIHGRAGDRFRPRGRYLSWVADAHRVHHRTGRAPYGFLVPIVPRAARATFTGVGTRARVANTS